MSFAKARQDLVSRPWARDDLDAVIQRWQQQPHRRALIFVDNSGSDIVLGELTKHCFHCSTGRASLCRLQASILSGGPCCFLGAWCMTSASALKVIFADAANLGN